jgi:hypothetical protein
MPYKIITWNRQGVASFASSAGACASLPFPAPWFPIEKKGLTACSPNSFRGFANRKLLIGDFGTLKIGLF